jgi:hypothetical protein
MRLLLSLLSLTAALSAADLAEGRYSAVFTWHDLTETRISNVTRAADRITVTPDGDEGVMQGRIVQGPTGSRLLLTRQRFVAEGILVDVVVADITEDGFASGYAHRSLNGEHRERIPVILRKQ